MDFEFSWWVIIRWGVREYLGTPEWDGGMGCSKLFHLHESSPWLLINTLEVMELFIPFPDEVTTSPAVFLQGQTVDRA